MVKKNKNSSSTREKSPKWMPSDFAVCVFLSIITFIVYFQVTHFEFIQLDDPVYIMENRHIQQGLTIESLGWSITATRAANWHPLTWLSHTLDIQLFGVTPGWHHMTNVLIHMLNTVLLFLVFKRMTGALWKSAFIAAIFALHPLHIESVAWISERKDVLSTFFWIITIWAYGRYVNDPKISRYLLIIFFFVLGLMSKPMLVTLPFVLLLLDYWPLKRTELRFSDFGRLLLEKLPFMLLAIASCVVTYVAQKGGDAIRPFEVLPITNRIENALVSYIDYIIKMIWPYDLAILYPHPFSICIWKASASGILIITISLLSIKLIRRHPWFAVGWFWYMGTLVPVIGIIQVGFQALADRYTYVPLIGLFIIIAWGIPEAVKRWRHKQVGLNIISALFFLLIIVITSMQLSLWCNSITLFRHALDITQNNYITHNNIAVALTNKGQITEAFDHYSKSLKIYPRQAQVYYNMGRTCGAQGKTSEAIHYLSEALKLDQNYADAHSNLGAVLFIQGKSNEALKHYNIALELEPENDYAHYNKAAALVNLGKYNEAVYHFSKALRINPYFKEAKDGLTITQSLIDRARNPRP